MTRYFPMTRGFVVTSPFGNRAGGFHWGTDFGRDGGSGGNPVFAMQGGIVTHSGPAQGFGRWVVVDSPTADGAGTQVYGHIIPEVAVGQRVEAGQRIARINPDSATNGGVPPHLHAEWHRSAWAPPGPDRLDPWPMLANAIHPGESAPPPQEVRGMTAELLSKAMGGSVSMERYRALLPAFLASMRQAQCTNLARATMWCAQLGHESVGLRHMREIADGSQYEGRADLGNTQPGDGVRFAGRGPIQVTGRHNYAQLSRWAHGQGYVPTATFFVDNPRELESDKYGFLGAVWYWTVARPGINAMCDAGDIRGVTKAINGGLNGLADREQRWNRCKQIGAALLPGDQEDDVALLDEKFTNYKGNSDLTYRDWFWWADKNLAELLAQAGPWSQTGGLSNTDALAAIGEHLGLPGFALPADHPYKQAHPEFGKKES